MQLACTWNVEDVEGSLEERSRHLRVTPLMVEGRLYLVTRLGIVAAIIKTGKARNFSN